MVLLTDGNLVLYDAYLSEEFWSTQTVDSGTTFALMQIDGNFILYTARDSPTWETRTFVSKGGGENTQNLKKKLIELFKGTVAVNIYFFYLHIQ
jgi:hypothetical protein